MRRPRSVRARCRAAAPAPATPTRSSARATPRPVSRVSSDDSSTSRGCSTPCTMLDRGGEVERAGQLRGDAQRVGGRRRPVSRTTMSSESAATYSCSEIRRSRRRCRSRSARRSPGASARRRSAARTRRRADGRARAADRVVNSLTATRRSRSGSYARKTGPERPGANLMKNPKWTEGVWRRGAGSFRVQ